jgi:hypothetical protein
MFRDLNRAKKKKIDGHFERTIGFSQVLGHLKYSLRLHRNGFDFHNKIVEKLGTNQELNGYYTFENSIEFHLHIDSCRLRSLIELQKDILKDMKLLVIYRPR